MNFTFVRKKQGVPPVYVDALARRIRVQRKIQKSWPMVIVPFAIICMATIYHYYFKGLDLMITECCLLLLVIAILFSSPRRIIERTVTQLIKVSNEESIAELIKCFDLPLKPETKLAVQVRLCELLPIITAHQYHSLPDTQLRFLRKRLTKDVAMFAENQDFTFADIDVAARVGTFTELNALKLLAKSKYQNEDEKTVVEYAQLRCDEMEVRFRNASNKFMLLRPSQPDQDLLRPASSPGVEDTDHLLRPADAETAIVTNPQEDG